MFEDSITISSQRSHFLRLKTTENQRFSAIFKKCKMGASTITGLNTSDLKQSFSHLLDYKINSLRPL